MPAIAINPPFPLFTDADGQPLDDAYIYIGTANQNPVSNPITVYWDSALTITAAQPIRTSGGYPVYNGTPARFYTNSDYSILVRDKNGAFIYTAASETDLISSDFVTFVASGAGATQRTVQGKLREFVSVKDFGAKGDGVADDAAAIQAALDSGAKRIYFPAGTYLANSLITVSGTNLELFGDGAASKITSSTLKSVVYLGDLSRSSFRDIAFETTVNDANASVYGVVWSGNQALTNVSFHNCYFYAQNANINGVKIINETSNVSSQINFIECRFENIQRMAIEFQNHVYDSVARYRSVRIERCAFVNLGVGTGYGYGISLSGQGENCFISNNTFDNVILGVELVGASDTTVAFNKFKSFGTSGRPFSFTGTSVVMYRNRVIGNTMEAPATGNTYIWTQQDLVMHGNYWYQNASQVYFKDIVRARISDDQYDSSGAYAVYIEGTSTDNQFVNCRISNQRSSSNFSTFRTYGATVTDTWLIGCYLIQGTGGVSYDGSSGAETPKLYLCKSGTSPSFLSDVFRAGYSYKNGLFKTAGAGVSATSITVDFGSSGSWVPAIVSLRIRSMKNDSSGGGYTENRLYLSHQGTTNVAVASNQVIGSASNLTVTTSTSGTVLTVTCTHSSATGANLYFIWDVEVDSLNTPIVA